MALASAKAQLPAFIASVEKRDTATATQQLAALKLLATEFPSQVAGGGAASEEEVAVTRGFLEHAVVLSVLAGDWPAFERHVGQLAPLHRAAAGGSGEAPGAGSMRLHVQGLALMHLLADARLGDFHCAAEALSPGEREVPYVAFPLRLEALLMEGGYNQILESGPSQPSPLYAPFLAKLAHTVRDDVADCAQAAYARLAVSEAARMLKLDVPPGGSPGDAVARYAAGRGLDWVLEGGDVRFAAPEKPRPSVDASALMEHALQYANDLERIV